MPTPPFPDDVLAYIVTFISTPSDLLSTSLANRTLATLVEPELAYRSIRCHLSKDNLWVYLVANPALAAQVRELEILSENSSSRNQLEAKEHVPGDIPGPNLGTVDGGEKAPGRARSWERSEILLIAALRVLVNLEKFTWDPLESSVNQGKRIPLELLEEEGEHATKTGIYEEDVWTVLRDYTQLRELKVTDLGRWEIKSAGITTYNMQASKIWSIRNLTSLDLQIFYAPQREDIEANAGVGDEDHPDLLPGRIDVSLLCTFLLCCPNLERLELAIHDWGFYTIQHGNPYTNLNRIFELNPTYWPHLSTLCLTDITIDNRAMTQFLVSRLRMLFAFLSLNEPDLPQNPFTLDGPTYENFLPIVEDVSLPPEPARAVLKALSNLAGVKAARILEPRDWGAEGDERGEAEGDEGDEYGEADVEELVYDAWGVPEVDPTWEILPRDRRTQTPDGGAHIKTNFLEGMTGLRAIVAKDVRTIDQLGRLADVAPQLPVELVRLMGKVPNMTQHHCTNGTCLFELLPHLSKWRRLTSFTGIPLWQGHNEGEREAVEALAAACPLLRNVTWTGGKTGVLVRDEQGQGVGMDVKDY